MGFRLSFLLLIFVTLFSQLLYGQKIDTIYHINGNVLTGDLKRMNYGVVSYSMDGMGTISLEEPKINTIKSVKQFEIKLKNGLVYFGSFDTSGIDRKVRVIITGGSELINIDDIVEVYPIRRSFWLRMSGNFSLGANYSKGSDVATFVFSGNLNYRKRNSSFALSWDNNNTFQADTLSSTKIDISLGWQRMIKNYWSLGIIVGAGQNSQLGYKLRIDLAAIGIRDIVYNRWNRLWVGAGLSLQRETPYEGSGESNDLAGVVSTVWKVYKYTNPKVWVDTDLTYVPYLTGDSRYRIVANVNPKVGLVGNDLKIGFKFYYSYDSRPSGETTSTFDWGINLEITYTLH